MSLNDGVACRFMLHDLPIDNAHAEANVESAKALGLLGRVVLGHGEANPSGVVGHKRALPVHHNGQLCGRVNQTIALRCVLKSTSKIGSVEFCLW